MQTDLVDWEGQGDPAKLHGHPRTPVFHSGLQMHKPWATPDVFQMSWLTGTSEIPYPAWEQQHEPKNRTEPLKPPTSCQPLTYPDRHIPSHPCLTSPLCPAIPVSSARLPHTAQVLEASETPRSPLPDAQSSPCLERAAPCPGDCGSSQHPACSSTPLVLASLQSG